MATDFFAALLMIFLTISGGDGARRMDLLDIIPTASYWRAKAVEPTRAQLENELGVAKVPEDLAKLVKDLESLSRRDNAKKQLAAIGSPALDLLRPMAQSEDPEAAAMAKDLIDSIAARGKERDIRRLMAIRTLGERKEKDSLPALKALTASKELFVADYAARAIAQIEGTPLPPSPKVNLADDLKLLPASTGILGQTTGLGLPGFTLEALFAQMQGANAPDGPVNAADKEKMLDNLTRQVLEIAEAVGNARADGCTVAVSAGIGGPVNEWVIVNVRGEFDREAVAAYVSKISRNAAIERKGALLTVVLDREARVLLTENRVILMAANPRNTVLAGILDPLKDALATGRPNALSENKPLDNLLKAVDKTGPAWVVGMPSEAMRQGAPFLAAMDAVSISAKRDKDAIKLTATAQGGADQMPRTIDQLNAVRALVLPEVNKLLAMSKDFQPLVDAVESVKIVADGMAVSATATVSPDIVKAVLAGIVMEFRLLTRMAPGGQ